MEELRARVGVERVGALLDQPQAEVHVAEQPPFRGLAEARPGHELDGASDVVQQRGGQDEVGAQPRVQLAELAADRRHADRVLEQAAGVVVVPFRRGRQRAQQPPDLRRRRRTAATVARSPACEISPARNSRKPSSSSASRRIAGARPAGSASGAASIERTSSCSRSR